MASRKQANMIVWRRGGGSRTAAGGSRTAAGGSRTAAGGSRTAGYSDPKRSSGSNPHASQRERAHCRLEMKVGGYQNFTLSCEGAGAMAISGMSTKALEVESILRRITETVPVSSITDVGCNSGLMLAVAFRCGFTRLVGIEHDTDYQLIANRVIAFCRLTDPTAVHPSSTCEAIHLEPGMDTHNPGGPPDVVLALAIIHWLYNCTADFGSLDTIIQCFRSMTTRVLVVEWVDPQDHAIKTFKHISANQEGYTRAHFEEALGRHFAKWRRSRSAATSPATRVIYVAFVTEDDDYGS